MQLQHAILVIEDHLATRMLYQRVLERHYPVLICADTSDALRLLADERVTLVILEPNMPNGQGWDLLAALSAVARPAGVPILLCSTVDERSRGLAYAAAYMVKPVLPDALLLMIQGLIGALPSRHALA